MITQEELDAATSYVKFEYRRVPDEKQPVAVVDHDYFCKLHAAASRALVLECENAGLHMTIENLESEIIGLRSTVL